MLHTKFQGHRSSGSEEEDFLRFLPYIGMAAMLWTDDGRTTEPFHPISSPGAFGSGELKMQGHLGV